MNPKQTINQLQKKEVIKCESCGQFHDINDCEVIIIKVIKGKNCELKSLSNSGIDVTKQILEALRNIPREVINPFQEKDRDTTVIKSEENKNKLPQIPKHISDFISGDDGAGKIVMPGEKINKPKRGIVPSGFDKLMNNTTTGDGIQGEAIVRVV